MVIFVLQQLCLLLLVTGQQWTLRDEIVASDTMTTSTTYHIYANEEFQAQELTITLRTAITGTDCINPAISFDFQNIDYDDDTEYITLYDEHDTEIQICQGGDHYCPAERSQCLDEYPLFTDGSSIPTDRSYTITVVQSSEVHAICDIYNNTLAMNATLTFYCNSDATRAPTTSIPPIITVPPIASTSTTECDCDSSSSSSSSSESVSVDDSNSVSESGENAVIASEQMDEQKRINKYDNVWNIFESTSVMYGLGVISGIIFMIFIGGIYWCVKQRKMKIYDYTEDEEDDDIELIDCEQNENINKFHVTQC
eukprot:121653_1